MNKPEVLRDIHVVEEYISESVIVSEYIHDLFDMMKQGKYPDDLSMIGLALGPSMNNPMLGVFKIAREPNKGYTCYRIVKKNNQFIIADVGYPVTNMESEESVLTCMIDVIIPRRVLYVATKQI